MLKLKILVAKKTYYFKFLLMRNIANLTFRRIHFTIIFNVRVEWV